MKKTATRRRASADRLALAQNRRRPSASDDDEHPNHNTADDDDDNNATPADAFISDGDETVDFPDDALEEIDSVFISDLRTQRRRDVGVSCDLEPSPARLHRRRESLDDSSSTDGATDPAAIRVVVNAGVSPITEAFVEEESLKLANSPIKPDGDGDKSGVLSPSRSVRFDEAALSELEAEREREKAAASPKKTDEDTPPPAANAKFFRHRLPLISELSRSNAALNVSGDGEASSLQPSLSLAIGSTSTSDFTATSAPEHDALQASLSAKGRGDPEENPYYVSLVEMANAGAVRDEADVVIQEVVRCSWAAAAVEGELFSIRRKPQQQQQADGSATKGDAASQKDGDGADTASVSGGSVAPSSLRSFASAAVRNGLRRAEPFSINDKVQALADTTERYTHIWDARKRLATAAIEDMSKKALGVLTAHLRVQGAAVIAGFTRTTVGGSTYASKEQGLVVHVWRTPSEARRYMQAFRNAAQAVFDHGVPLLALPVSVLVTARGSLATATSLMPLARPAGIDEDDDLQAVDDVLAHCVNVSRVDTPMLFAASAMYRCALNRSDVASSDAAAGDKLTGRSLRVFAGTDGRFYPLCLDAPLPLRLPRAAAGLAAGDAAPYARPEAMSIITEANNSSSDDGTSATWPQPLTSVVPMGDETALAALLRRVCVPRATRAVLDSLEGVGAQQFIRGGKLSGVLHDNGVNVHMLYDVVVELGNSHASHAQFSAASECLLAEMAVRTLREIIRADCRMAGVEPDETAADRVNRALHASLLKKGGVWTSQVLPVLRSKFRTPPDFTMQLTPPLVKHIAARLHGKGFGFSFEPSANAFTGSRGAQLSSTIFSLPDAIRHAVSSIPNRVAQEAASPTKDQSSADDAASNAPSSPGSPSARAGGGGASGDFDAQTSISVSASTVFAAVVRKQRAGQTPGDDDAETSSIVSSPSKLSAGSSELAELVARKKDEAAAALVAAAGGKDALAAAAGRGGSAVSGGLWEVLHLVRVARILCLLGATEHADVIVAGLVDRVRSTEAAAGHRDAIHDDEDDSRVDVGAGAATTRAAVEVLLLLALLNIDDARQGALLGHVDGLAAVLQRSLARLHSLNPSDRVSTYDAWPAITVLRSVTTAKVGVVDRLAAFRVTLSAARVAEYRARVQPYRRVHWYFQQVAEYCKSLSAIQDADELRNAISELQRGVDVPTLTDTQLTQRRSGVLVALRKATAALVASESQQACKKLRDLCNTSVRQHEERFGSNDPQTGVGVAQGVYIAAQAEVQRLTKDEAVELKKYHAFVMRFGTVTAGMLQKELSQKPFLHSLGIVTAALARLKQTFIAVRAMHHSVRYAAGTDVNVKAVERAVAHLERRARWRIREIVLRRKNPEKLAVLHFERDELHHRLGVEIVEESSRVRFASHQLIVTALAARQEIVQAEQLAFHVLIPERVVRSDIAAADASMRLIFDRWTLLSEARAWKSDQWDAQRADVVPEHEELERAVIEVHDEPTARAALVAEFYADLGFLEHVMYALDVEDEEDCDRLDIGEAMARSGIAEIDEPQDRIAICTAAVDEASALERAGVTGEEHRERRAIVELSWKEGYTIRKSSALRRRSSLGDAGGHGDEDAAATRAAREQLKQVHKSEEELATRMAEIERLRQIELNKTDEERAAERRREREERLAKERDERRKQRDQLMLSQCDDQEGLERRSVAQAADREYNDLVLAEQRERMRALRRQRAAARGEDEAFEQQRKLDRVHTQERAMLEAQSDAAAVSVRQAEALARRRIVEAAAESTARAAAAQRRRDRRQQQQQQQQAISSGADEADNNTGDEAADSTPTQQRAKPSARRARTSPKREPAGPEGSPKPEADDEVNGASRRSPSRPRRQGDAPRLTPQQMAANETTHRRQLALLEASHRDRLTRLAASASAALISRAAAATSRTRSPPPPGPGTHEAIAARVKAEREQEETAVQRAREEKRQRALDRMAARREAEDTETQQRAKTKDEAARLKTLAPDSALASVVRTSSPPPKSSTRQSAELVSGRQPQQGAIRSAGPLTEREREERREQIKARQSARRDEAARLEEAKRRAADEAAQRQIAERELREAQTAARSQSPTAAAAAAAASGTSTSSKSQSATLAKSRSADGPRTENGRQRLPTLAAKGSSSTADGSGQQQHQQQQPVSAGGSPKRHQRSNGHHSAADAARGNHQQARRDQTQAQLVRQARRRHDHLRIVAPGRDNAATPPPARKVHHVAPLHHQAATPEPTS